MKPPAVIALHLDQRKLPAQVFQRFVSKTGVLRDRRRREDEAWENFGKPGRDPGRFNGVLSVIAQNGRWTPHLKIAELSEHWDQIVGVGVSEHSQVADFRDGTLTIHAESTVWATQLTYLIPQLTDTIRKRLDGLEVHEIRVTGPQSRRFNWNGGAGRRR